MSQRNYKVQAPGYKTTYYQSFMGAYQRAINMLHADDEIPEIQYDYGPTSGIGIWERTRDGWRLDTVNTAEAWREVTAQRAHSEGATDA